MDEAVTDHREDHADRHGYGGPDALAFNQVPYTLTIGGTGWSLGNAQVISRYVRMGRMIVCKIRIVWGTTSTFGSGGLTLAAPVPAAASAIYTSGQASYSDAGTGFGWGFCQINGGTITPFAYLTTGNRLTGSLLTTTSPHVWAATDDLQVDITYEAAS